RLSGCSRRRSAPADRRCIRYATARSPPAAVGVATFRITGERMLNHVMVGSNDIERSKRFYDAVLGVLGAGEPLRHKAGTGQMRLFYRHNGSTFCVTEPSNGEPATAANGGTIGFKCDSPEQVHAFHE